MRVAALWFKASDLVRKCEKSEIAQRTSNIWCCLLILLQLGLKEANTINNKKRFSIVRPSCGQHFIFFSIYEVMIWKLRLINLSYTSFLFTSITGLSEICEHFSDALVYAEAYRAASVTSEPPLKASVIKHTSRPCWPPSEGTIFSPPWVLTPKRHQWVEPGKSWRWL